MADAREEEDDIMAAALASSDGMVKLISSLPLETRSQPFHLRQLGGFWLPERMLLDAAAVHASFEPRPDDIFLASFPKSGTTWLKALAFATINRAEHPPSDPSHPLRLQSPHDCVSFLEVPLAALAERSGGGPEEEENVFKARRPPRVLATHMPYQLQPKRITAESSGCRIVYIYRDHKDALVSGWLFTQKTMAAMAKAAGDEGLPPLYQLEEAFERFCDGHCICGPQWLHVLGFLEESQRRPDKVLFLRYEEMLRDPASNVKKLAEFMGCPFSVEEEAAGMVDAVVELCSLDSLRRSKGNQSGVTEFSIPNGAFFRKGVAGDWHNYLTLEMAARLDKIVDAALQGSALAFGVTADNTA